MSNIDRKTFERLARSGSIQIEVGGHAIGRLVETYADIGENEVCALFGSTDHLEFAANSTSAVEHLGVDKDVSIIVTKE